MPFLMYYSRICNVPFRILLDPHDILRHLTLCLMNKWFALWIALKEKLHGKITKPPRVNEGDIWWVSIGENIGHEINGKNEKFTRPVIIFKKFSNSLFFVIPLTTKIKYGTWFVTYTFRKYQVTACLHQARTIDYRRFFSRLGELDKINFDKIKASFLKLYK